MISFSGNKPAAIAYRTSSIKLFDQIKVKSAG